MPEPKFKDTGTSFVITFRKDIYTEKYLSNLGLNERQIEAVMYAKSNGKIASKEYQEICSVKKRQASDDLKELEDIGILERVGTTGKGTHYVLKGRQRGDKGAKQMMCQ